MLPQIRRLQKVASLEVFGQSDVLPAQPLHARLSLT